MVEKTDARRRRRADDTRRWRERKRLGLLRELVPQATTIGVLLNPAFSD
jgi:hypothetical protein